MISRLQTTVDVLRHFGPGWLMFRVGYAFRKRSGMLRRALPASAWEDQPLAAFLEDARLANEESYFSCRSQRPGRFFFTPGDVPEFHSRCREWGGVAEDSVAIAGGIERGVFRLFEHHQVELGCPPDWHRNPFNGDEFPRSVHWTQIGDFAAGDVKLVWEPNRFAWVYPLVRTYWRTGDERYPRLFWRLFEDWRAANPPQQGVNWKCGQEVAIRLMACCFALYGFAASPETTPQRVARLAQVMAVSANRIEKNFPYALSQQNNHGITEAAGLWTVGLLFPEFAASSTWTALGRAALEQQTQELIDEAGAFSQHSANYQRVMLDACVWSIRLGQLNDQPLSDACIARVLRAGDFLWQIQDEASGRLPRFGQNDGALILPLTNCEHADYRPVIQLTAALDGVRRFAPGPWDEAAFWLHGGESLRLPESREERDATFATPGGYQVLRTSTGHLLTRAPNYRFRPAHADALHVDLWWRGQNIAIDAGTRSYNAAPPWNNPLAGTACHNTVSVDGEDQMQRVGRFLWLPWLKGRRLAWATSPTGRLAYWEGSHDGYARLAAPARHRRAIVRIGHEHWLVLDRLDSRAPHAYRLHWLLCDVPYEFDEACSNMRLQTGSGDFQVQLGCLPAAHEITLVRADVATPRGWYAPHYADRQPALSLAMQVEAAHVTFATLLGPAPCGIHLANDAITAKWDETQCRISLRSPDSTASHSGVSRSGGRVRSDADGPALHGSGLPVGQTRPPRNWVLPGALRSKKSSDVPCVTRIELSGPEPDSLLLHRDDGAAREVPMRDSRTLKQ